MLCSCLIARNLLSGLKTCMEVSSYMYNHGAALPRGVIGIRSSFAEETEKFDADYVVCLVTSLFILYDKQVGEELRILIKR